MVKEKLVELIDEQLLEIDKLIQEGREHREVIVDKLEALEKSQLDLLRTKASLLAR